MGGGAWPFLVGGAICLVNSVNERDLSLLTSYAEIIAIVGLQRGIPSKRESSARVDYVPALCTHRPSLLPIEWSGEVFGSRRRGRPPSPLPPVRRGVETRLAPPRRNNEPRRELRQGKSNERARSRRPGHGARPGCVAFFHRNPKRLSATDISALASMKNVAKCDTWCELQNPVNHRVFERKLRPKPLGRGHVCLGVTHRCPPAQSPLGGRGVGRAETGLPCAPRSRLAEIRVLRRPGRDDRW
ncbi:Multiple epidermal growth factor-like domains protein 8 [Melia azedarach]|nr:Multiple epidermal growth factor-like domains protein 8 [Melia azedarach]